jgi:hypothetical protein
MIKNYDSPRHDPFKSDIYSFGMTLLYVCTLIDPIEAYDFKNY